MPTFRLKLPGQQYVIAIIVGLTTWELGSWAYGVPMLIPPVEAVFLKIVSLLKSGLLPRDIFATLARTLAGFAIGSLIGATLGVAMGQWKVVRQLLEPYINFLRFIPGLAWISIVMLMLGIGEVAKVSLIVYTTCTVVLVSTLAGIAAIPAAQMRAMRSFGANDWQTFAWVFFPASIRHILSGMRLALSTAFLTVVSAEMIVAEYGLGFLIINARLWMAMDEAFIGVIFIALLGLVCDRLMGFLITRFAGRYYGAA